MLYTAIALFSGAAALGLYLLTFVWQKKETPKGIAILHGLFAASALVLLIVYAATSAHLPLPLALAIALFVTAALGGFVLISRDLAGKSMPAWLALLHGLLAVSGFILLLVYAFSF
jgi:hypothetical protein